MNQAVSTKIKNARTMRNLVLLALIIILPLAYGFFIYSPSFYRGLHQAGGLPYFSIFNLINIILIYVFYYFESICVNLRRHWLQAVTVVFLPFIVSLSWGCKGTF